MVAEFTRFSPVERVIDLPGGPLHIWHPPDIDALIDVVAFEADERIPYWANVWESALVLAEDLASSAGSGLSLIELGCGLGLPALVAARQGFLVTATDYEEAVLEGVRFNAHAMVWPARSPPECSIGGRQSRSEYSSGSWRQTFCMSSTTLFHWPR